MLFTGVGPSIESNELAGRKEHVYSYIYMHGEVPRGRIKVCGESQTKGERYSTYKT